MSTLDIVFLVIIGLFALKSFAKGFIKEIVSIAALVLGLVCAMLFFKPVAELFRTNFGLTTYPEVAAFLAIFVGVFVIAFIVEKLLHGALEAVNLEGLDRILGLLLGILEGAVFVGLAILAFQFASPYLKGIWDIEALLSTSTIASWLAPFLDFRQYVANV